jgi:hypothetical protein
MKEYVLSNNIENHLFLFAAGPFTNILTLETYKVSDKNTYLDVSPQLKL